MSERFFYIGMILFFLLVAGGIGIVCSDAKEDARVAVQERHDSIVEFLYDHYPQHQAKTKIRRDCDWTVIMVGCCYCIFDSLSAAEEEAYWEWNLKEIEK